MNITIVGAGQVGYQLARYLSQEKHNITVIDTDSGLIDKINDTLDVIGYLGSGVNPETLGKAGIATCDMLIAVTRNDATNMLACQLAHSLYDIDIRIARVRFLDQYESHARRLFSPDNIPVTMAISPEREIAKALARQIKLPGTLEIIPLGHQVDSDAGPQVQLLGVSCSENCPIVYTSLRQLTVLFPDLQLTILAIIRGQQAFVPDAEDEMLPGDIVYFTAAQEHVRRSLDAFGHREARGSRLTIIGGGFVGASLLQEVIDLPFIKRCRVIESDKERAEWLANQYPAVTVIHGSAADLDLMEELTISDQETAVAITNSGELNVVAASILKARGCGLSLAVVSNQRLASYIEQFPLDAVVNPHSITISTLLRYIRRGKIYQAHTLRDGFAECLEGDILPGSPLAGKVIKELDLPDDIRIASIIRGREVISPRPNVKIEAGDTLALLSLTGSVRKAQRLLSVEVESL